MYYATMKSSCCCYPPSTCCFILDLESGARFSSVGALTVSIATVVAMGVAAATTTIYSSLPMPLWPILLLLSLPPSSLLLLLSVRRQHPLLLLLWLLLAASQLLSAAAYLVLLGHHAGWRNPSKVEVVSQVMGSIAIVSYFYLCTVISSYRSQVKNYMTVSQRSLIRSL